MNRLEVLQEAHKMKLAKKNIRKINSKIDSLQERNYFYCNQILQKVKSLIVIDSKFVNNISKEYVYICILPNMQKVILSINDFLHESMLKDTMAIYQKLLSESGYGRKAIPLSKVLDRFGINRNLFI